MWALDTTRSLELVPSIKQVSDQVGLRLACLVITNRQSVDRSARVSMKGIAKCEKLADLLCFGKQLVPERVIAVLSQARQHPLE